MQKFIKFWKQAIMALALMWGFYLTAVTIKQASANMIDWEEVFNVEFGRR